MLQSWYNSASKNMVPLYFSPCIHYFCRIRAVRTGNTVWFCLKNAENAYNKNVIPINIFVIIIDLQRFIYNFAIWILKR